jgi:hypothetical protein
MATPAEEARKYAAEHGFLITSEGRRYRVVGNGIETTVGGYPAALNTMRHRIESLNGPCDTSSIVDRVYPVRDVAEEPVTLPAHEVRTRTASEILDDMRTAIAWVHQSDPSPRPAHVDVSVGISKDADGSQRLDYSVTLPPFEAIERVRARARDMVPHWRIVVDSIVNKGERLTLRQRYASRSDALKQVRRMLCDRASGMRARHVTIEYRA